MGTGMKVNGDLIKQLRRERSMSQEDLAAAAGLSVRTMQRMESEGITSLESSKAVAGVLGVVVTELSDKREEIAQATAALRKGVKYGIGGALVGAVLAFAAIGYGFALQGLSGADAGIYSSIVGTIAGISCMVIGVVSEKLRRRIHGGSA